MRLPLALTALSLCGACTNELSATPPGAVEAAEKSAAIGGGPTTLVDTRLTYYTLVTEADTSGQHTGDGSLVCDARGLSGCYQKEFLCSGWGVPMQGTGVGNDRRFVHYVGGGTWGPRKRWLTDCSKAQFEYVGSVTGKSGRELVPHYSVAVDQRLIPLGWSIWIDSEGGWFRADDTGAGITGKHIDIYRGLDAAQVVAEASTIFATPESHRFDDPSPWQPEAEAEANDGWAQFTCGVDLDSWGTCEGGYAYWCEGGTVMYKPCSDLGMACGVISPQVGYYCL